MLNIQFFSEVNYLHVLVAGLAYWLIGAIWYMALFSKPWAAGVEKWGIKMGEKPDSGSMMKKMIISLLCNLGAALIIGWFVHNESDHNVSNVILGSKIGFCGGLLAVLAYSTGDNWLSKPKSTFMVDASYHIIGLTLTGAILGAWN